MTKIELIKEIGDTIKEVDDQRGNLPAGTPDREALDNSREELNQRQLKLAGLAFKENTQAYIDASANIAQILTEMKATIRDLAKIAQTLESLTKLVGAIDELFKLAA